MHPLNKKILVMKSILVFSLVCGLMIFGCANSTKNTVTNDTIYLADIDSVAEITYVTSPSAVTVDTIDSVCN